MDLLLQRIKIILELRSFNNFLPRSQKMYSIHCILLNLFSTLLVGMMSVRVHTEHRYFYTG